MTGRWPAAHPEHGRALDKTAVAKLCGVADKNTVDAWITRTRQGKLPTPFPPPDGAAPTLIVAHNRDGDPGTRAVELEYWWEATILRWLDGRRTARRHGGGGGSRQHISAEVAERIRRRHIDGQGQAAIARDLDVSTASVSRIVRGVTHRQEGSSQ